MEKLIKAKQKQSDAYADYEVAKEEVVAESMQQMLTDTDAGAKIAELCETERGRKAGEKISEYLKRMSKNIKEQYAGQDVSPEARMARKLGDDFGTLADMFARGVAQAAMNYRAANAEGNVKAENSVRYELRPGASTDVEKAIHDKNYRDDIYLTESSPSIIASQKGVRNLPMLMRASHVRENILTEDEAREKGFPIDDHIHYHGLGKTLFLNIIDGLDKVTLAYRGTKNASNPNRRENYFLLISQYKDSNENSINVPIYINEKGQYNRVFIDTNKIATAFGRDNFQSYIQNELKNGNLVRIKNKSTQVGERTAANADGYGKNASNISIRNESENVKTFSKNNSENSDNVMKQERVPQYTDYDKPITLADITALRSISKKSINDFTSEDIQKAQKWAYKFYKELGTKSPFFRAWFGDWRQYDTVTKIDYVNTKGDERQSQINRDTGWNILVSRQVHKETSNHRGSSETTAVKYLPYIDDITRKAILFDTQISDDDNPNSLLYHTMYAYTDVLGYPALLRLRVEELYSEGHGSSFTFSRDYILQNIREENISSLNRVSSPNREGTFSSPKTISDLYSLVKTYDKDFHAGKEVNPVLLNEDGTPRVLYHGTNEKFTEFSPDKLNPREASYFFAENKEDAKAYGDNIYSVYLSGEKLADYDNQSTEFYKLKSKREQVSYLKEKGYDGWYSDMDSGGWGEVSVFSPSQVKSATDNIGTFDRGQNDIMYQERLPSERDLLVAALEEVTDKKSFDYEILTRYKTQIEEAEKQRQIISDMQEKLFTPSKRGDMTVKEIREEMTKAANRLDTIDKKLLRITSAKPFKRLLERERAKARRTAKSEMRENYGKKTSRQKISSELKSLRKMIREQSKEKNIKNIINKSHTVTA